VNMISTFLVYCIYVYDYRANEAHEMCGQSQGKQCERVFDINIQSIVYTFMLLILNPSNTKLKHQNNIV
jgi:hypothetical protein